ncbi:hypothetical protein AB0J74_24965 [Asanoa sp. NPDC049573]|uniref:hypothetical protein n=1 Tax=Asanoa sp. NPDC049573 TaxID=3155396 RepID=UPI0034198B18
MRTPRARTVLRLALGWFLLGWPFDTLLRLALTDDSTRAAILWALLTAAVGFAITLVSDIFPIRPAHRPKEDYR